MSNPLRIRLFGHLEIARGPTTLTRFPTRKARALFAYLALHAGKLHARERLSGLFWPESSEAAARKRLRTELWHVRRFLAEASDGASVVVADNGSVGINPTTDVWIDRVEFEEKLAPVGKAANALTPADAQRFAEAVELYRGDLLEGCYEDWCLEAREYSQSRWVAALEKLMAFYQERGEWELAIRFGEKLLCHEPLAEHVHRELMRCHWQRRNRTAALRQYQRCVAVLETELDVEPMPETTALCREIRTCQV